MDEVVRPRARTASIWLVGATAAAAGLIGSFLATLVATALYPGTVGSMGFPPPRGFSALLVAVLFGFPLSTLVGAVGAYLVVLARRPAVIALGAVLCGVLTGALVGWGTSGLANWWATAVEGSGPAWVEIALALVAATVSSVLLSGRVALEMARTSRRARLAMLISGGVLVGALAGMLFGGVIGFFSEFQSPCPPPFYPVSPGECQGVGLGLGAGWLFGMWLGAAVGALCALVAWAVPPWTPGSDEETLIHPSNLR